jgi:hypothetical protein
MPRTVLAALAALVLASPAAAASPRYSFGRAGGNILPFTVTIAPGGAVTVSGPAKVGRTHLTAGQLAALTAVVAKAHLASLPARTVCAGTLPDFASTFVSIGGRTVYVRGSCSPSFTRAWNALAKATQLADG